MFKAFEPEDHNAMKDMLKKGDQLRDRYRDFDFDKLDAQQRRWLGMMSIFTRLRPRIEQKFEPQKVTMDLKVIFIE
jgi:hypothetical protein